MTKYFILDESPVYKNKYIIRINEFDKLKFPHGTRGSYNILEARLLGLSYADYLRYARDRLGAELVGKNTKYPIAYFNNTEEVYQLVKLLNKRMEYILLEQEYPYDYRRDEEGKLYTVPFKNDSNT